MAQSYSDQQIAKTVPFIDLEGMKPEYFKYNEKGYITGVTPKFTLDQTPKQLKEQAEKDTLAKLTGATSGVSGRMKKGKKTINDAYASLMAFLTQQQNPWSNLKAQHTNVDPQLQQLLQSQGADTTPTQQFASMLNTQGQGQADAFQNLI